MRSVTLVLPGQVTKRAPECPSGCHRPASSHGPSGQPGSGLTWIRGCLKPSRAKEHTAPRGDHLPVPGLSLERWEHQPGDPRTTNVQCASSEATSGPQPAPGTCPGHGCPLLGAPAEGTGDLGVLVFCRDVPNCRRCVQTPALPTGLAPAVGTPSSGPAAEVARLPRQELCMRDRACGRAPCLTGTSPQLDAGALPPGTF